MATAPLILDSYFQLVLHCTRHGLHMNHTAVLATVSMTATVLKGQSIKLHNQVAAFERLFLSRNKNLRIGNRSSVHQQHRQYLKSCKKMKDMIFKMAKSFFILVKKYSTLGFYNS
jgi:hypothetical protein